MADNNAGAVISEFLDPYSGAQEGRPEAHEALELTCRKVGHEESSV
ncbi:hypothetical protein [Corynebacterium hiratae]|nr:hypothetical protein [Corynebacterium aurimucosum]